MVSETGLTAPPCWQEASREQRQGIHFNAVFKFCSRHRTYFECNYSEEPVATNEETGPLVHRCLVLTGAGDTALGDRAYASDFGSQSRPFGWFLRQGLSE